MTTDTVIIAEFKASFRPTEKQVAYVKEYTSESGLSSLIVAVSFLDEAVMDGGLPAIWVDQDSAVAALDNGKAGSALLRVYSNGSFHLVDEA